MPEVTENTFERLSLPIVEYAEELTLWILLQLRHIQERLISDPNASIRREFEIQRMRNEHRVFLKKAEEWIDEELSTSYLRGIERANSRASGTATAGALSSTGLLVPDGPSGPVSTRAKEILSDYPEHHTMYGVFRQAADDALRGTEQTIVRQHNDRIRDIIIGSSDIAYRDADEFTRRDMSQDLMRHFADEGIHGIRYSNGRLVKLDSYTEMVARSQTKNAFNQANWNRLQEYGIDLIAISVHYPCSDLCQPYQGKVFSVSGSSDLYPSLEEAIANGLFHANCKHSSSGYTPGRKSPETPINKRENENMYEAQKMQRYNERQIKQWKRREASAVDPRERDKAKAKIREWQGKQREHIDSNPFLRRKYDREQI